MSEDQLVSYDEALQRQAPSAPIDISKRRTKGKGNGKARTRRETLPPAKSGEDGREIIQLSQERRNANTRQCAQILREVIYLRGRRPMLLARAQDLESDGAESIQGTVHGGCDLVLCEPGVEQVQFQLNERVLFEVVRMVAGEMKWVPAACPKELAKYIIENAADLGAFRQVAGIAAVPIFSGGRIDVTSGYHEQTGLILDLSSGSFELPPLPGRAEAEAALDVLLEPFAGYFAEAADEVRERLRSGFAAAALTAVLRPSLPTAPAILIDANVPGSGKGKAARALSVIATGRAPSIVTEGHSDEETEKRIATAILSGVPTILLDNLQRTLASSTLESAMTEGRATIRAFGRLADVTTTFRSLVVVTANNAALRADMLRRTLPVRIVVGTDQPELRHFSFEPYEKAQERRSAIVSAGLTIARAWWRVRETDEGRRIRTTTLGSFERWADLVAGAVEWLTTFNPISLIEEQKAQDPRRGQERAVLEALAQWQEARGGHAWYAKEAASGLPFEVWESVLKLKGEPPAPVNVASWLRSRKDKVFGTQILTCKLDRKGIALWHVQASGGCGMSIEATETLV